MNIMWNNVSVALEKHKLLYFAGLVVFAVVLLSSGKAFAAFPDPAYEGYWWSPNHGNSVANGTTYNFITDDAYMQHVVSYDGFTDILDTTLKIYSTDPYISVEVFGADLCTNQPSYTTDEFFPAPKWGMYTSFNLGPADDEPSARTGVYAITGVTRAASPPQYGNYKTGCTADNSKRTLEARSNIYDETMGMYVFNFRAAVGATAPKGFINGFRIRALRNTVSTSGIVISQDPGQGAEHFGLETGYPRQDNSNPDASTTYPNYAVPFVPDCEMTTVASKYVTIYDDDNNDSTVQGSRLFKVKVERTNGADANVPFTNITGEINAGAMTPDASGYYTVIGGNKRNVRLYFNMDPNQGYIFRVLDLFQDNTLQISLPSTTSPVGRNCPEPATLSGVKIDDTTPGPTYVKDHTGPYKDTGVRVKRGPLPVDTTIVSSTDNPFSFSDSIPITRPVTGNEYTVKLDAIPPGWAVIGATICDSMAASCNNDWLADKNNIGTRTGTSFQWRFYSNKTYHMRWIFTPDSTLNCEQLRFAPDPDLYTPFTFTSRVFFNPSTYSPLNPTLSLRVVNASNAQVFNATAAAVSPSAGGVERTSGVINLSTAPNAGPAGNYTFSSTYLDSSGITMTCNQTVYVGYKPYVNVLGGDIWAGSAGGAAANIRSWNNDNMGSTGWLPGAGAQHAALASGSTTSFSTARLLGGGLSAPAALGFANNLANANVAGAKYGAAFAHVPNRTDYYAMYESAATPVSGTSLNLGSLTESGTYIYADPGDLRITGTLGRDASGNGLDVKILSAGNAILLGSPTLGYEAYASFAQIPRLSVFTASNKNIMVAQSLTEIHGIFATGPGGKFFSCAINVSNTPVSYAEVGTNFDACRNPLKIYGSVQADELVLSRTYSSLRAPGSVPAEEFVYSPELWLARPGGSGGGDALEYRSYIGLPPIL